MNNELSVQDRIDALKKSHQDALVKKTRCEAQLETAQNNLAEITKQCADKGLMPEQLPAKLTELQNKITSTLNEASALLPIIKPEGTN